MVAYYLLIWKMVSKSVGRSVKLPFDQLVMFSTASAVPLVPHLQELEKFLDLQSRN